LCRYWRAKRANCSAKDTQSNIAKYLSALKTLFTATLFIHLSLYCVRVSNHACIASAGHLAATGCYFVNGIGRCGLCRFRSLRRLVYSNDFIHIARRRDCDKRANRFREPHRDQAVATLGECRGRRCCRRPRYGAISASAEFGLIPAAREFAERYTADAHCRSESNLFPTAWRIGCAVSRARGEIG
jgi:hypothetical protein